MSTYAFYSMVLLYLASLANMLHGFYTDSVVSCLVGLYMLILVESSRWMATMYEKGIFKVGTWEEQEECRRKKEASASIEMYSRPSRPTTAIREE